VKWQIWHFQLHSKYTCEKSLTFFISDSRAGHYAILWAKFIN
jgi:hypothetical protein